MHSLHQSGDPSFLQTRPPVLSSNAYGFPLGLACTLPFLVSKRQKRITQKELRKKNYIQKFVSLVPHSYMLQPRNRMSKTKSKYREHIFYENNMPIKRLPDNFLVLNSLHYRITAVT